MACSNSYPNKTESSIYQFVLRKPRTQPRQPSSFLYLNADLDVGNEGRRGLGFRFDVERVHLDLFAVQRFDQRDLPVAIDRELDRIVELTVLTGNDAEVEGRIVKR